MDTLNVFQKLQSARIRLSELKLEKTGENKFSHYFYFELSDFLPSVQKIFHEVGLIGVTSFTADAATLTIYDSSKPSDFITFSSPMAGADLKGMHAIQNMGAVETYQRRYLYMAALEITEPDTLDAKGPQDKEIKPKTQSGQTPAPTTPATTKEYPPDDKPWINDTQVATAIRKIQEGEYGIFEKCKEVYKISKANYAKLSAAKAAPSPIDQPTDDLPF